MGQVLHGSARTTEAVRRAIQHSEESLRALAKRYGVNQKTIAKWRKRSSACDQRTGPKEPRSTVLSVEDEAIEDSVRIGGIADDLMLGRDGKLGCESSIADHSPADRGGRWRRGLFRQSVGFSPRQFSVDCTINMFGRNFRQGQPASLIETPALAHR
jgi:hypothetical protein